MKSFYVIEEFRSIRTTPGQCVMYHTNRRVVGILNEHNVLYKISRIRLESTRKDVTLK